MSCDCFSKVNATLAEHNEQLVSLIDIRTFASIPRVLVSVEKVDPKKRTRLRRMLASFCPFCGTAYEKLAAANGAASTKKASSKKT